MLYINNLGPEHNGCDYISVLRNPAEPSTGLNIVISQDEANHEHVFTLSGVTPSIMQSLVPNNNVLSLIFSSTMCSIPEDLVMNMMWIEI